MNEHHHLRDRKENPHQTIQAQNADIQILFSQILAFKSQPPPLPNVAAVDFLRVQLGRFPDIRQGGAVGWVALWFDRRGLPTECEAYDIGLEVEDGGREIVDRV